MKPNFFPPKLIHNNFLYNHSEINNNQAKMSSSNNNRNIRN